MPGNIANPAGVLQGDPPQYRARPTWDLPAQHANNAAAAAVSICKQELTRHSDYTLAESALARALLASLGETNVENLRSHSAPDYGYHDGEAWHPDQRRRQQAQGTPLSSLDVVVGPREPHGKLPVGLAAPDTERPRGNPVPLFRALPPNSVGFPLGGA
jgi:hypothetical protein